MTSSTTGQATPPVEAVGDLRASLRGELVLPADVGYDEHRRVWNGSIDRRPAAPPSSRDARPRATSPLPSASPARTG